MLEWEAVAAMIDTTAELGSGGQGAADGELRPAEPHAREDGSTQTACGLDATSMAPLPQRWEAISLGGKCEACFAVTQEPTTT